MRLFSKSRLIFLGLVVLAFSVRSIYFSQTAGFIQPGAGSDSYFYLQWAKDIVRGNFLGKDVFYALPVYPYFLSLAYLFSEGEVFALILIQILIGASNCGLIYLLGRRLFNNQVGIIASLIACAYPMFIFYDRMLLPASLAIFLGLLSALLLLRIRDNPSLTNWFAAGLLLGLCTLARASFFLLAVFVLFWMSYEYKKKRPLKQLFLYCASFILPFFLIIGGVTLRNYLAAGDAVLISAHSGINFYIGNNPQADGLFKAPPYMRATQSGLIDDARIVAEQISARRLKASEVSGFWLRRAFYFIRTQPLNYLRLLGKKFVLFWNGREHIDEVGYYIFGEQTEFLKFLPFRFSLISPLALLGIILSWPLRKRMALLYFFVFGLALATIFFFINSRYRLAVVPYLIIFAAFSFWQLFAYCKNRQYKNLIFSSALFLALYFLANIKAVGADACRHNFTFHYNKGVVLCGRGHYQKARKEFEAALKLNPRDFMSYLGLGNLYHKKKDWPEAIDNYRRALAVNPYFYDARFNLGLVYEEIGRREEAERQFKAVLKINPEDCPARYNLGRIYQEKGLNELALKEYKQALKAEPGHHEILQAIKEIKGSKYEK